MNQSWKINDTIQMFLSKDRKEAISDLVNINIRDIASELYDLNQNLFKPIQNLLDKFYNQEEFEKVCQNNLNTIQNIIKRVWIDSQKSINNSNSQYNNQQSQHDQLKNQRIFQDLIEQQKNKILIQEHQIEQQKNKILFQEDQINQFIIDNNKLINLNNQLFETIFKQNNKLIQLELQLQEKTNEIGIILFKNQLKYVNENSLNIDLDCQKYKEKIDNINKDREEVIRNMEDILKQFEQIQSQNILKLNKCKLHYGGNDYENIINQIKEVQVIMELMQKSLERFQIELNLNQKNENNQELKIIKNLLQKLNGNQKCFISVKQILNQIVKMLIEINKINVLQYQKNQELYKELKELQIENNEIKDKLSVQINQLKEYNQQEQQGVTNERIKQNCYQRNCLDISNKYSKLFNEFNDQIMLEIYNLSKIMLIWFQNENINPNIHPSSQLLQDIQSFINSIKDHNLNNDNDGLEQQLQRSMELFKKIYPKISNNSIVNQYIYRSFERIQEIKKKILEYNKDIQKLKQRIENQAKLN